jgi:predicted Zn-dependent protease
MTTRTRSLAAWAALLLAGLAASGCNTNLLSRDEEIRIGRDASVEIEKQYPVSTNPVDNAMVEGIGQKLVAANGLKNWPFTFKILENRDVNAVSLPGGPVYVFRGLIDMAEGDVDEIAAVVAHEIGHIEKRHAARRLSRGILADLLILLGTRGTVQSGADVLNVFVQMRFSRDDEYQSDDLAIAYAFKAGYDPNGLVRFFEKLKRREQGGGDIVTNNLRTHPLTDARIKRAKERIAATVEHITAVQEAAHLEALQKRK